MIRIIYREARYNVVRCHVYGHRTHEIRETTVVAAINHDNIRTESI